MWAEIDQIVLAHAAVLPGYLSHLSNTSNLCKNSQAIRLGIWNNFILVHTVKYPGRHWCKWASFWCSDPDPDWYQNDAKPHADLTHVGKSKTFLAFGLKNVKRCVVIFSILHSILKCSGKKLVYQLFHFLEIESMPIRIDRIRIDMPWMPLPIRIQIVPRCGSDPANDYITPDWSQNPHPAKLCPFRSKSKQK